MAKTTAKANVNESETVSVGREENTKASKNEVTYTVKELINASEKALGVPRECAVAAFKLKGAEKLTLSNAKKTVEEFMKRKVK